MPPISSKHNYDIRHDMNTCQLQRGISSKECSTFGLRSGGFTVLDCRCESLSFFFEVHQWWIVGIYPLCTSNCLCNLITVNCAPILIYISCVFVYCVFSRSFTCSGTRGKPSPTGFGRMDVEAHRSQPRSIHRQRLTTYHRCTQNEKSQFNFVPISMLRQWPPIQLMINHNQPIKLDFLRNDVIVRDVKSSTFWLGHARRVWTFKRRVKLDVQPLSRRSLHNVSEACWANETERIGIFV